MPNPAFSAPASKLPMEFLLLSLLLIGCTLLYWPGLNSLFLFDDFPNLRALAQIQGLGLADAGFREFVYSGESGPLGRPLSLLTFALQAEHWPANPAAFKWVNLLIHLINGMLVAALVWVLARLAKLQGNTRLAVVGLTTGLWLLHPAHTATVLYTVQRMTLLSSMFMLAALVGYLKLRIHYFANWQRPGFVAGALACAMLALAGLLSKEVAGSLLFYVVVLEYTLLARVRTNCLLVKGRPALWVVMGLLVAAYAVNWSYMLDAFAVRYHYGPFTRLITETRILWFQLLHIFVPGQGSTGIFIHFEPSAGLLQPITTLLSVPGWIGAVVLAVKYRHRYQLVAFAVLWFLGGQVIESTVLPLELYFAHRNYLPMLGPLLFAVWGLQQAGTHVKSRFSAGLLRAVPLLLLVSFAIQLALTSRLWSNSFELAYVWFNANPDEIRNEQFFANELAQQGALEDAITVYQDLASKQPDHVWPHIALLTLSCYTGDPGSIATDALQATLARQRKRENDVISPLRQLNELVNSGQCLTADMIPMEILLTGVQQGMAEEDRGFVQYELARYYLKRQREAEAMDLMQSAWELTRDPGILYNQANYLISIGEAARALALVETGLQQLAISNRIETGTREQKQQAFNAMREYLLANLQAE